MEVHGEDPGARELVHHLSNRRTAHLIEGEIVVRLAMTGRRSAGHSFFAFSGYVSFRSSLLMKRWLLLTACLLLAASAADACEHCVLRNVNAKRAARGLPPFTLDAGLQSIASREAQMRASQGQSGHRFNGPAGGSKEGVGWYSGHDPNGAQFNSCFLYVPGSHAVGVGVATSGRGTYYQLNLR